LIFDIEKLEKFDDRYSDIHLKGENVKIEVKIKIIEETEGSGDFGDFLDVRSIVLNTNNNQNNDKLSSNNGNLDSNSNCTNTIYTFQNPSESQESPDPLVDDKKEEEEGV
jgi:hypothetical protein